jgi:trehalose 6-phosphate phosphatase
MLNFKDYYSLIGFCPGYAGDASMNSDSNSGSEPDPLSALDYNPDQMVMMLDFDGTLVDIAPTPDAISFTDKDAELLKALESSHEGAIAIVSGRAIDDLQAYLTAYSGAIAGGHGAEFRMDGERSLSAAVDEDKLMQIKSAVRAFVQSDERILLEEKATGMVMHFRAHPVCEDKVVQFASALVAGHQDFKIQEAKMAIEIKPTHASKEGAMEKLVEHASMQGRKVFFAGDDTTDEAAFGWVNKQGGVSVKIGPGPTSATHRIANPSAFKAWLSKTAAKKQQNTH